MNQWLERSLDDSAIKRIIYPEVFMLVEYILLTTTKILTDICVDNDKIKMLVDQHMPFILSEEISEINCFNFGISIIPLLSIARHRIDAPCLFVCCSMAT